ncbi:MAG: chorismate-binding protein, partial [Pseudomonadota bacterium]
MVLWEIDWREPLRAFAPLAGECDAHLLHGGALSTAQQWSVITAFPEAIVGADHADPFRALDEQLQERRALGADELAGLPFLSGAVGFVAYEAARFFEPSLRLPDAPFQFPDVCFGLYDAAALFSRTRREAFIAGRSAAACRRLRDALGADPLPPSKAPEFSGLSSNFTKKDYQDAVAGAIENILNGDFYQVNLTHQLAATAASPLAPFNLFRLLTAQSDAGHGALLQYENGAIVSNSPERFFKI